GGGGGGGRPAESGRQGGMQSPSGPGGAGAEVKRTGAGRGIPDFKDNAGGRIPGAQEGDANGAEAPQKFNAQEASEWLASRYQAVMDDYEKQKQQSGKKGDIQNFSD
ncbi:unnamed protein product, partial [Polarella glacialis]